ncbi:hypothetical protein [Actinoplanes sp. URMC 104]|uniref:hypothetical protein n=1 Tax=Actinoplanes sp. URMC 104 TaxID=3423409 RepID=UPI003F1DFAE3
MRMRLTTASVLLVVAASAGCSSSADVAPGGAGPASAPASSGATAGTPASPVARTAGRQETCAAFIAWLSRTSDDGDPRVRDYVAVQLDPDGFSAPGKNEILRTYFAFQERELRPVAEAAADPALRKALGTLVDGIAARARDTTATKTPGGLPAQAQIIGMCHLPGRVDNVGSSGRGAMSSG